MSALTISRRLPSVWRNLYSTSDELERLLGRRFPMSSMNPPFEDEPMTWVPATDLVESDGEYVLTAELPGMGPEDVEIAVEAGVLSLKGTKRTEREEKKDGDHWHLVERSYGSFERSFSLPASVEADKIKADFANGVLTVHFPKRAETKGRKIAIDAGRSDSSKKK
jgi:HSP20 family protein